MKREPPSRHYRLEGNEEVLETGLLLQKMRAISLHALFAVVCLSLFCGLTSAPPRLVLGRAYRTDRQPVLAGIPRW
jgi:hypothetical protein